MGIPLGSSSTPRGSTYMISLCRTELPVPEIPNPVSDQKCDSLTHFLPVNWDILSSGMYTFG